MINCRSFEIWRMIKNFSSGVFWRLFWWTVSLFSTDWPWTRDPAVSASLTAEIIGAHQQSGRQVLSVTLSRITLWVVLGVEAFNSVSLSVGYFGRGLSLSCTMPVLFCCVPRWADQLAGIGSWAPGASSHDRPGDGPRLPTTERYHGGLCHDHRHQRQQAFLPTVSPWKGISHQGLWSRFTVSFFFFFFSLQSFVLSAILWSKVGICRQSWYKGIACILTT